MKIDVGNIALREEGDGLIISERGNPELSIAVYLKGGKLHISGPMNRHGVDLVLDPEGLRLTVASDVAPAPPAELYVPPYTDGKTTVTARAVPAEPAQPPHSPIDEATDLRCLKTGKKVGKKEKGKCKACTQPGCKLKGDETIMSDPSKEPDV